MPVRFAALGLLMVTALGLASCQGGGHFCLFGYTTQPNYDLGIRTIYVPIFKNNTLRRGVEFDLTRAVHREIEAKTPYKIVSDPAQADTELTGCIIALNKNLLNRNQNNEVREAEMVLAVEVVWRDKRSGEVLSGPRRPPGEPPALVPESPVLEILPPPPPPALVTSVGGFIPEIGGSITTAEKQNFDRLAIQIVSMMEKPW